MQEWIKSSLVVLTSWDDHARTWSCHTATPSYSPSQNSVERTWLSRQFIKSSRCSLYWQCDINSIAARHPTNQPDVWEGSLGGVPHQLSHFQSLPYAGLTLPRWSTGYCISHIQSIRDAVFSKHLCIWGAALLHMEISLLSSYWMSWVWFPRNRS